MPYVYESNGTGWFVGIIVALALLAIGYLVFSANSNYNPSESELITSSDQKDFMLKCAVHTRIDWCDERWEILSKRMN